MKTEIKLDKGVHVSLLSFLVIAIWIAIWGITMPDVELYIKVCLAIVIPFWFYYGYKIIVRINEPVITLTDNSIQILNENRHHIFLWTDILDYEVNYKRGSDSVEYSLKLKTKTDVKIFKINGISKNPEELRELINNARM